MAAAITKVHGFTSQRLELYAYLQDPVFEASNFEKLNLRGMLFSGRTDAQVKKIRVAIWQDFKRYSGIEIPGPDGILDLIKLVCDRKHPKNPILQKVIKAVFDERKIPAKLIKCEIALQAIYEAVRDLDKYYSPSHEASLCRNFEKFFTYRDGWKIEYLMWRDYIRLIPQCDFDKEDGAKPPFENPRALKTYLVKHPHDEKIVMFCKVVLNQVAKLYD